MSIPRSHHLAFGSGTGLVRMDCAQCRQETIHKFGSCIHCGTNQAKPKSHADRYRWSSASVVTEADRQRYARRGLKAIRRCS